MRKIAEEVGPGVQLNLPRSLDHAGSRRLTRCKSAASVVPTPRAVGRQAASKALRVGERRLQCKRPGDDPDGVDVGVGIPRRAGGADVRGGKGRCSECSGEQDWGEGEEHSDGIQRVWGCGLYRGYSEDLKPGASTNTMSLRKELEAGGGLGSPGLPSRYGEQARGASTMRWKGMSETLHEGQIRLISRLCLNACPKVGSIVLFERVQGYPGGGGQRGTHLRSTSMKRRRA